MMKINTLILAFAAINSCQTLPDGLDVRQAMCDQFGYITYSRHDTDETVRQIGIHNRVLEAVCHLKVKAP